MIGSIDDALNFMSKTSWRRMRNAVQIYQSYHRSRAQRTPRIAGMPVSISIEPTTSCNLRCPECPSGLRAFTRPTGMLDAALFQNVIDQLAPTLSYLTFYFQGEPYLHPAFLELVNYASSRGIYTATSTNAHYLTEDVARRTVVSGLDRLVISIDGTTQAAYEAYRIGGSLEKVLTGTRNVIAARNQLNAKKPHVVFQFLVVGPNEHQIPEIRNIARQFGVDQVVLKTAQIYDFEKGSPLIPRQDRYSRYRRKDEGSYALKAKTEDHCWKMWHSCVVTWDGKVVPCCFDKDAQFVLGDLKRASFEDIWYGDAYHHFRKSILGSRNDIQMCRNCTEGTKVFV